VFGTLCQISKTRPATIHLTAIDEDGSVVELHISSQAARLLGLDLHNDPPDAERIRELLTLGEDALKDLPEEIAGTIKPPVLTAATGATTVRCPDCGLTYGAFVDSNRFGCARCYTAFEDNLESALSEIQGATTHLGRMPSGVSPDAEARERHRAHLRAELDAAVADERYEDAARLRDQLSQSEDPA
jgi:protein arginine kinase activator